MRSESAHLRGALDMFVERRGRPVLWINGGIDDDAYGELRGLAQNLEGYNELSVILQSPGGYAGISYKMISMLRRHADDIEVIVPELAKSAATLFCLGADTIYMGPEGELGPLDPQIRDRAGSARPVSALESFKALEQLHQHSLSSFDDIVQMLLQNANMDVPHAINHAKPLFAAIVSPLYQQIDPHELGEAGRYLAESEYYAVRAMARWGYQDRDLDDVADIVRRLIRGYPSHGFIIDLMEAQRVGLNAAELDAESDTLANFILARSISSVGFYDYRYLVEGGSSLDTEEAKEHHNEEEAG